MCLILLPPPPPPPPPPVEPFYGGAPNERRRLYGFDWENEGTAMKWSLVLFIFFPLVLYIL